jgi:hypothetical protein
MTNALSVALALALFAITPASAASDEQLVPDSPNDLVMLVTDVSVTIPRSTAPPGPLRGWHLQHAVRVQPHSDPGGHGG